MLNTGTLTVANSTIRDTADGNGGGIANEGSPSPAATPTSLSLRGVTIAGNAAGADGGGFANLAATALARSSTVTKNSAASEGGGIANEDRRSALTLASDGISSNSAGDEGGGIATSSYATTTSSATTVDSNTATNGGGGVAVFEGGALMTANGEIDANSTTGSGGGVSIDGVFRHEQSTGTITGTSINGNSADTGGGVDCPSPRSASPMMRSVPMRPSRRAPGSPTTRAPN